MSDLEKWEFLATAPTQDARAPEVRRLATLLSGVAELTPEPGRAMAALALTVARDLVRQLPDVERVGHEDVAGYTRKLGDPLEALRRGVDDCDAKARLFVAICLAAGMAARMRGLWRDGKLAHVYGEVNVGGQWLPAETTLARARIGDPPQAVPREATGEWRRS